MDTEREKEGNRRGRGGGGNQRKRVVFLCGESGNSLIVMHIGVGDGKLIGVCLCASLGVCGCR